LGVKGLLLVVFILTTNGAAWQRAQEFDSFAKAGAFLAFWGVCATALICVAFSPYRFWRYLWTVVLVVGSFVSLSHWLITRTHLRLADLEQLFGLLAFSDNVLAFYGGWLFAAALICLIGIAALNLPPYWRSGLPGRKGLVAASVLLPFLPVAATAGFVYVRGGEGSDGLGAQFSPPAFALVLGLEGLTSGPPPKRREVAIAASGERRPKTVAVIMDESVRGDLLDINRPGGAYSGLLAGSAAMANFGIMSSIATCSSPSNAGFRYGVARPNYLEDLKTNPSIWRYAKKAGYRTVYIDGQRHGGGLMNLMTAEERADIDEHVQLATSTRPMDRDIEIARHLRRIIQDDTQVTFVYVNKAGAHFPYEGKYPPEHTVFRPVLRQTYFGNEIDPKNIWYPESEDADTRTRFRNSYLNVLAWNVGKFFDTLLEDLDLSKAVVLYMADHGQNLNENGDSAFRTHCSTGKAPLTEGMVPLVVLTSIPELLLEMRRAAQKNRDRASQFNVFPSVLALMGYRPGDIARSASSELPLAADLPPGQQQFLSTFFARLGRKPVWNSLEPDMATASRNPAKSGLIHRAQQATFDTRPREKRIQVD
jgi:glucan phosphoethanolaminetransferase (alkaline phosphatase superfamily)